MDETPFACVRCAAVNPTCCRIAPGGAAGCFPLSRAEEARLAPHAAKLGVPSHGREVTTPEFLKLMRTLFPDRRALLEKKFPLGGEHLRLPLGEKGECLFLQADGCALPREGRPWYCQMFPLWVREGAFDYFMAESCLLAREARGLGGVFAGLGTTREETAALYRALCRDWGLEKNDE